MVSKNLLCKYHPDSPARWHCPDCALNFCKGCIQATDRDDAFCPICNLMLKKLNYSVDVLAFWKRMPASFLYPLHLGSLIFLVILSLASLLQLIPLGGIVAAILLPFILMKYAFQVLQHTASGYLSPPKGSTRMDAIDFELPFKMILLIILLSVVSGLLAVLGKIGIIIALIVLTLSLPAMIIVLGVTRSFFSSINPLRLFETVKIIGPSYFGLFGMLFLLVSANGAFFELISSWASERNTLILNVIVTFINSYYTIVMFHIMGYVTYQFHKELGIQPAVEYEQKRSSNKHQKVSFTPLAKAQVLVQEGHPELAKNFISKNLNSSMSVEQIQLHELYLKLLSQLEEGDELKEVGRNFIVNLLDHEHRKKALQMYRFCYENIPVFQLNHAEYTHQLVETAHKASDYDISLILANNFAKNYPDYPKQFDLYLLVARILHDHFNRGEQAGKILKTLIAKFPQHESIQSAKLALNRIERVQHA